MHIVGSYPASLAIDYPERALNRLTSFFRPFTVIPAMIILALISGPSFRAEDVHLALNAGGFVFVATALMLLFRQKYPRWWFDWNVQLMKFSMRVAAYLCLLRDEYPSTDREQAVHVNINYPDASKLSAGLPLVKWLLALPHYIVLAFLAVAVVFCVFIAWFAILFTGKYPPGLFRFVESVLRWHLRVFAYAFLLVTDEYPPFSLNP